MCLNPFGTTLEIPKSTTTQNEIAAGPANPRSMNCPRRAQITVLRPYPKHSKIENNMGTNTQLLYLHILSMRT